MTSSSAQGDDARCSLLKLTVGILAAFVCGHSAAALLMGLNSLSDWRGWVLETAVAAGMVLPLVWICAVRPWVRETERRRRLQCLWEQERDHSRFLFDHNPHPMWVYDCETLRFRTVNLAAIQRYGYSREEFLAMTIKDIRPAVDVPDLLENVARVNEGLDRAGIWRHVRRDGSLIYVEITSHAAEFEGRKSEVVLALDVTDRVEAEQARQASEARCHLAGAAIRKTELLYQTLFEPSPDGVIIMDPETTLPITFNDQAHLQLGYTREEFCRMPITGYEAFQSPEEIQANVASVLQTGKAVFEATHLTKDRRLQPVQVIVQTIEVDGRKVFHCIFRDLTERKHSERQIREQARLLELAHDAIVVVDLSGSVQFWNQAAEQLYGWTKSDALGQNIEGLIFREAASFERLKGAILRAGEWSGEVEFLSRDKRMIIGDSRLNLVRSEDREPHSILAIITDVTERKTLEAQYLRAQRLESIGTLAGGMAHDMNNVLGTVMMAAELFRLSAGSDKERQLIKTLEASAQRGANILRQVLTFARGTEGERMEVQLRHLLKEMANIAKDTFTPSIKVSLKVPNDLWTVMGDATQLHQVLMNLCVNARDAMPDGGKLQLCAFNLLMEEEQLGLDGTVVSGPHVIIEIADSGAGIPAEIIDKIFLPFYTTKGTGKGTGLGLSTSLGIVKSHHGFIRVESTPGEGTVFRIGLPATQNVQRNSGGRNQPCLPSGRGESILVVDDETAFREITGRTLETFGYQVLFAQDGQEALAIYLEKADSIDLVLLDLLMPGMDGMTLARHLRRMNPAAKIVLMSGMLDGSQHGALAGEVNAFLFKPFSSEQLLQTLHGLFVPEMNASLATVAH